MGWNHSKKTCSGEFILKITAKSIINGDKRHDFKHDIRTVIEHDGNLIVLLSIPFDDNTLNNIFCLNGELDLLWRAEDVNSKYPQQNNLPYEHISLKDGTLYATDFYGRCYLIDTVNGELLGMEIVK